MDLLLSFASSLVNGPAPPTRRRPEEIFRTKEDVVQHLHRLFWNGTSAKRIARLCDAFQQKSQVEADEPYWTSEILAVVLASHPADTHSQVTVPALWRLVKTMGAYPFLPDESDRLYWTEYLAALGLALRGRVALAEPGYFLEGRRRSRPRSSPQCREEVGDDRTLRLVFRALATPDSDYQSQNDSKDPGADEVIDVMACCMDISDDKFAWGKEDFGLAVDGLSGTETQDSSGHRLYRSDLESLMRVVAVAVSEHINSIADGDRASPHDIQAVDNGWCSALCGSQSTLDLTEFRSAVQTNVPCMGATLDAYLASVLSSILPDDQAVHFRLDESAPVLAMPAMLQKYQHPPPPPPPARIAFKLDGGSPMVGRVEVMQLFGLLGAETYRALGNAGFGFQTLEPLRDIAAIDQAQLELVQNLHPSLVVVNAMTVLGEATTLAAYSSRSTADMMSDSSTSFLVELVPAHRVLDREPVKVVDQVRLAWSSSKTSALRFGDILTFDVDFRSCIVSREGHYTQLSVNAVEIWYLL